MMVVEVYFVPAGRRAFHQNDEFTLVGAWRRPIFVPRGLGVSNTNDALSNRPQPCIVEEGPPLTARGLLPPPMDRLRVAANIEPESRNDRPLRRTIASLTVRPIIGRLFVVRSVLEVVFAGTIRTRIVGSASNGACPFVICPRVQIDTASGPARSTCTRRRRLPVGYSQRRQPGFSLCGPQFRRRRPQLRLRYPQLRFNGSRFSRCRPCFRLRRPGLRDHHSPRHGVPISLRPILSPHSGRGRQQGKCQHRGRHQPRACCTVCLSHGINLPLHPTQLPRVVNRQRAATAGSGRRPATRRRSRPP